MKPEVQESLLLFQEKCHEVLYNVFFGSVKSVKEQEHKRFYLNRELRQIDSTISSLTLRKKAIYKEMDDIDSTIAKTLDLFPDEGMQAIEV